MILYFDQDLLFQTQLARSADAARWVKHLSISLRRDFAEACLAHTGVDERELASLVWEKFGNTGAAPSDFLFVEKGILLKEIHGIHGVSLDIDRMVLTDTKRPVVYHGHNENSSQDREWLQETFQRWTEVAAAILEAAKETK